MPGVYSVLRVASGDQLQSSSNPKILLINIVWYDSLMMKIALRGGTSYFVAGLECKAQLPPVSVPSSCVS